MPLIQGLSSLMLTIPNVSDSSHSKHALSCVCFTVFVKNGIDRTRIRRGYICWGVSSDPPDEVQQHRHRIAPSSFNNTFQTQDHEHLKQE